MYTTHGHQIPGTTKTYPRPVTKVQCGEFTSCSKCLGEAFHATMIKVSPEDRFRKVSLMEKLELQVRACTIVARYYNERREDQYEIPELTLKDLSITWFNRIERNWKATITTNIPDDVFYEVTYVAKTKTTVLEVFKKIDKVVLSD